MSKYLNYLAPSAAGALGVIGAAYMLADQLVHDIPAPARGALTPASAEAAEPSPTGEIKVVPAAMTTEAAPEPRAAGSFGLGRPALPEEIAAWDLDVQPDGTGLPAGSGDVWTGEEVFADNCAICHGDFAEGVDNWPKLAGGANTLDHEDPLKTVGSYWPYLSTTWDYVNRSMPFGSAQTLSADEVYAIVAYILYSNDLVDDDFVLSKDTFFDVEMPNAAGFIVDDRDSSEAHFWNPEPCMENCKDSVEITMRARVLDVTPDEGGEDEASATPAMETHAEEPKVETAAVTTEETVEEAPAAVETAAVDPELVAAGEKVFKKCKACHQVGDGAKHRTGPILNGIAGAPAGAAEGFKYSKPMLEAAESGLVWSDAEMAAFLSNPKKYMKGTKMSFAGLKKDSDIEAITAFLKANP